MSHIVVLPKCSNQKPNRSYVIVRKKCVGRSKDNLNREQTTQTKAKKLNKENVRCWLTTKTRKLISMQFHFNRCRSAYICVLLLLLMMWCATAQAEANVSDAIHAVVIITIIVVYILRAHRCRSSRNSWRTTCNCETISNRMTISIKIASRKLYSCLKCCVVWMFSRFWMQFVGFAEYCTGSSAIQNHN